MVKTVVKIDGMMCGMCEAHINEVIRRAFPVKKVKSSHRTGEVGIFSEEQPDTETLLHTLGGIGYPVLSVVTDEYGK